MVLRILFWIVLLVCFSTRTMATNYYCDSENGKMSNSGTENSPWSSMQDVFDAKKKFISGDTLFLHGGQHGNVLMFGRNSNFVVIKAFEEEVPLLSSLSVMSASYWKFEGLHISDQLAEGKNVYSSPYIVTSNNTTDHLFFEECEVYTTKDDISEWSREKWFTSSISGFLLKGTHSSIHNCYVKNVNFGITIEGRYSEVIGTTIENFVGDGIRALSSFSRYEYNTVKNSFDITGYNPNYDGKYPEYPVGGGNHDDCFQSYTASVGGVEEVVEDVVVRWNKFISYTNPEQIDKSACQAIGCFDGYFYNWTVSNNLIVTDMWNGITFMGIEKSVIANNTVVNNPIYNSTVLNNSQANNYTPWIWIGKIKDSAGGGPSNDNIVRNNLIIQSNAGNGKEVIDDGTNTIVENNLVVPKTKIDNYFTDYKNLNYNLKKGSPAINTGINIDLPSNDLDKQKRLLGSAVDCGAFEYNEEISSLNCPEIDLIKNIEIKVGQTLTIQLVARDPENDPVQFQVDNLPDFIVLSNHGDGTASLDINPASEDVGTYKITVSVSDGIYTNERSFYLLVKEIPVGINNYKYNDLFKIFPNPVLLGKTLQIKMLRNDTPVKIEVEISNLSGQLLYRESIESNKNSLQINTACIGESGTYCVRILDYSQLIIII